MSTSDYVQVTVDVPRDRQEAFARLLHDFYAGQTNADEAIRRRAADREQGLLSLQRLVDVAQGQSGQCRHVARFLAGLYNGYEFPFVLTTLRALDEELFEHCVAVLRLDYRPQKEVHQYVENGQVLWQDMIGSWGLRRDMALQLSGIVASVLKAGDREQQRLGESLERWQEGLLK